MAFVSTSLTSPSMEPGGNRSLIRSLVLSSTHSLMVTRLSSGSATKSRALTSPP